MTARSSSHPHTRNISRTVHRRRVI